MHSRPSCLIEPLEPRIAPSTLGDLVISNLGKTARWTDLDGDQVTLTSTRGVLDDSDFVFLDQQPGDIGYQLALLNLSDDNMQGGSLTFTARRAGGGGDGFVNVGWLNAFNSDLATIVVPGDLARLDVGDPNPGTTALASIVAYSAGIFGAKTQGTSIGGGSPTLDWSVLGRLGAMTVKGDFGANLNVLGSQQDGTPGSTGAITVLGDLFANDPSLTDPVFGKGSGYLFSTGAMGAVRVAGNIYGGSSKLSGSISSFSSITSVNLGGTLNGGGGDFSGEIYAQGALGAVFIGGDIVSGHERDENGTTVVSTAAGSIGSAAKIAKVTVIGNVIGGQSYFGGSIYTPPGSLGKIGPVTIGGTLSGHTEVIGTGASAQLLLNGIYSDSTLGAVKVGALLGLNPGSPVSIIARGKINPTLVSEALAIASVTVTRGGYAAQILAGFDAGLFAVNPDVQIGAVKVGNSWQGSSIAAGISPGPDFYFGNGNDAVATPDSGQDNTAIRSKIASITIGGYVFGSSFAGDSFAFTAQEITAVKIGGTVLPMTVRSALVGPDDFLIGVTHDVRIREL